MKLLKQRMFAALNTKCNNCGEAASIDKELIRDNYHQLFRLILCMKCWQEVKKLVAEG